MFARISILLGLAAVVLAGCDNPPRDIAFPDAPLDTWVLRQEKTPKNTWENYVAYDPLTRQVVQHGGHVTGSYVQSNYTWLYDVRANEFKLSHAPRRPQRRCLVEMDYLGLWGLAVTTQGGSGHGSMPVGEIGGECTQVYKGDPRGPWLYDPTKDTWEESRVTPPIWRRVAHNQTAYDASSDALVAIADDKLQLYCPRTNSITLRDLPEALHGRLCYGIAADPINRKVVIFGGTGPGGWVWQREMSADEAYKKYVHNDTWLYDVASDTWTEVKSGVRPPLGMPLHDHIKLPMVYHDPSGTILLLQNPVDSNTPDRTKWGAAELWSFSVSEQKWAKLQTQNNPAYTGLMTYAAREDLLILFGGGRDAGGENPRPALSRQLYTIRLSRGYESVPPTADGVNVRTRSDGKTEVTWELQPNSLDYIVERAEASPFVGSYKAVSAPATSVDSFVDETAPKGKAMAYRVVRVLADKDGRVTPVAPPSRPVFNQPFRPRGLVASVESDRRVVLTWDRNGERDVVGYKVYRVAKPDLRKQENWKPELLTPTPTIAPNATDTSVDLGDGVARAYYVTAVNAGGVESGPSPLAYTMPDAVLALDAEKDGDSVKLTWDWPSGVKLAGFDIYHHTRHFNTHGEPADKLKAWWDGWTKVNDKPVDGRAFTFKRPADAENPNDYFYLRAVNVLGQSGFNSDIVSATDIRFQPAVD